MSAWNEDDFKKLKAMWLGNTAGEIGKSLGRTRNAVIGAAHRMSLPLKVKFTDPERTKRLKSKLMKPQKKPNWTAKSTGQKVAPTFIPQENREGGIPLMELQSHHCRAIVGSSDGYRGHMLATYCGEQTVDGLSYCTFHASRYYNL